MELIALGAAALITATISGMIGMGGGMSLLGVMTAILPASVVVPTHGVAQLTSNFTRTFAFLKHVKLKLYGIYAPFLLVGAGLATWLYDGEKMAWFKPGIGAFILIFLVWRRFSPKLRAPPIWVYPFVGTATGLLTVFVGATGPFIAPFFLRDDLTKEQIIGTKAACQATGHALKIPAFLYLGFDYAAHWPLLVVLCAGAVVGTFLGKWLLGKLTQRTFVWIFEIVLAALAVYLIASGLLSS
jgi:uncharacterized membrane protein YfcA